MPVGLGVDGAASNEASSLLEEMRQAVLFARARGGPEALTVRDALEMATMGGARCWAGRTRSARSRPASSPTSRCGGSTGSAHADIDDPVAALVFGAPPPLELLLVGGRPVVEKDRVVTVDETDLAAEVAAASKTLLTRAGVS